MLKLFNNKKYVISLIKQDEKEELIKLAEEHDLDIIYPELFESDGDLRMIAVDDKHLGGIYATFICRYNDSIIKNKNFCFFRDFKELKQYVFKADQRQEPYFLVERNLDRYLNYVNSLSNEELEREYYLVKTIVDYIDGCYLKIKDEIDDKLIKSITQDIDNNNYSKEIVNNYLSIILDIEKELDEILDMNIYLMNKDNCSKALDNNVSHIRMRAYLRNTHNYIHSNKKNGLFLLDVIRDNLNIIFNIFNYKLVAEHIVAYDHHAYDCLRMAGYKDGVIDYVVGTKEGNDWNYLSVLQKLKEQIQIVEEYKYEL